MRKRFLILFLIMFLYNINVQALTYAGCEYSDISNMKKTVTNVNAVYSYRIVNDVAYFDITLTNLDGNTYFIDNERDGVYKSFKNGEITIKNYKNKSVMLKFYSNKKECKDILLGSKYIQLPIYNKYWNKDVCKDITGLDFCNKWSSKVYTLEEVKKNVDDYKKSLIKDPERQKEEAYKKTFLDKLIDLYVKYYIYVLAVIIVICVAIIEINKRKNRFKI